MEYTLKLFCKVALILTDSRSLLQKALNEVLLLSLDTGTGWSWLLQYVGNAVCKRGISAVVGCWSVKVMEG